MNKKEEALMKAFRSIGEPPENILMWYIAGRMDKLEKIREIDERLAKQVEYEVGQLRLLTKDAFK